LATFSTRLEIGGLPFHNWEEYGKSKTKLLTIDYLTIFSPNLGGVG